MGCERHTRHMTIGGLPAMVLGLIVGAVLVSAVDLLKGAVRVAQQIMTFMGSCVHHPLEVEDVGKQVAYTDVDKSLEDMLLAPGLPPAPHCHGMWWMNKLGTNQYHFRYRCVICRRVSVVARRRPDPDSDTEIDTE